MDQNPLWKNTNASLVTISPTFYDQIFHTKVLCIPFLAFDVFDARTLLKKAALKLLVKLTLESFFLYLLALAVSDQPDQLTELNKWQPKKSH